MTQLLTPAPDFRHALGLLGACHRRIEGFNDLLLRLPTHLDSHGADAEAGQAAQRILKYFDSAALHHHEDEERDLFPMVKEAATQQGNHEILEILDLLLAQHREMTQAWQDLRPYLQALAQGEQVEEQVEEQVNSVALPAEYFVSLYRQHIPLEDNLLLPYAVKTLTPTQVEALGEAMAERRGVWI